MTQSLSGYTPNNSLDRSGGSVFRIKRGAAKVALMRAARSTLTLDFFLIDMAFIPKDAKWYLAWLVEEIIVEDDPRNMFILI
ncbi:MAG: hypothetical protein ABR568_03800 [Pyrinomonadaceae bacterium]